VDAVAIVRQPPAVLRWISTGTLRLQAGKRSRTRTRPFAISSPRKRRETARGCFSAMTVNSVALDAVPPGPVTVMGPVDAPLGTVAVMRVSATRSKAAL
jgi:hypothetical protein